MSFQFCRRKFYFLLALALPGYAAVHPVQHSAREQVNAQVLNAASQKIESLAQQRQWHDYRYTFKIDQRHAHNGETHQYAGHDDEHDR